VRITTANSFERSIDMLQRRASEMGHAQDQLVSGKKIAKASDDPTGAARVERALAREARSEASQRGLEASRTNMTLAETALGSITELMHQVREQVVQAGNPAYSDVQRKDIATVVKGLRDQILKAANTSDGAGGYLFGAQGASTPPFVDAAGGVQFMGAQGQAMAASGEPLPLTSDGGAVFLRAAAGNGVFVTEPNAANGSQAWISAGSVVDPSAITGDPYEIAFTVDGVTGNTTYDITRNGAATAATGVPYVGGKAILLDGMSFSVNGAPATGDRFDLTPAAADLSIFDALDQFTSELSTPNRSGAQRTQTVQTALRDLDSALSNVVGERARLGGVLSRIDSVENRLSDDKLMAQSERSTAEDVDMVQAVSDFSARQTSYNAALQAYGMVQKLSLFDYIR
jgi:flagellar hook-associated protein 3 FlgL